MNEMRGRPRRCRGLLRTQAAVGASWSADDADDADDRNVAV